MRESLSDLGPLGVCGARWWGASHVEASEARKMIAPLMSSLFIIRRTAVRRE